MPFSLVGVPWNNPHSVTVFKAGKFKMTGLRRVYVLWLDKSMGETMFVHFLESFSHGLDQRPDSVL